MASSIKQSFAGLLHFLYRATFVLILFLACGRLEAYAYPPLEFAVRETGAARFHIDYNGDTTADRIVGYGAPSDIGLVGDFDGDTITDLAVYRDGTWYIDYYNDTVANVQVIFGGPATMDTPIAGDFNNDGKADIAVYRKTTGLWYADFNLDGTADRIAPLGGAGGDLPVVGDFNGDGNIDRAIFRSGTWFADFDWNSSVEAIYFFGGAAADLPFAGDFNNDGVADLGVFRNGTWYIDYNHDGVPNQTRIYGGAGMLPCFGYFNPANSVFVRAGATGAQNGTQTNPYASINAALTANPPSGTIIRITTGLYAERVTISQKSNLTFQGSVQGPNLTGTTINPTAGDAFTSVLSTNITLRDLHINSNGPDGSTPGRGVVNLGSSMTLERVGAIGSRNMNLVASQYFPTGIPGSVATLTIDRSKMDASQIANGIQLETGTTATITRSSMSGNGTMPASIPPPPAAPGGRGIVLFNNASLNMQTSTVNSNYDGGFLATGTAAATLQNNTINSNGFNGVYYEAQTTGSITNNTISSNGTRGPRGGTGYNGVEIAGLGAPMTISGNNLSNNSLNGLYVGDGTVTVTNNIFFNNFLGMTIDNPFNRAVNVTIKGNTFELPNGAPYSEGIFMASSTNASMTITIGGVATPDKNTFRNYGSFPAIHCHVSSINAQCVTSGNIFINSTFPVQNCPNCNP